MNTTRLAAVLGISAMTAACGTGGGRSSSGTSSGSQSTTLSSSGSSSLSSSGVTGTGSRASSATSAPSGSTSGSSSGSASTSSGSQCTSGTVHAAFQTCTGNSDCACPQICVETCGEIATCQTPCPGPAPGTFGGACQVVTAGDGTCQPTPFTGADGGASLAGFCILNGTEAAGGSSSCALDMFCGSADPTQLCIAGQICATTGVGRACSTLCATPGQTGSCTGGQQCNFLFPGYSSAGYCGACMPVEGRCFADADCCNGSCRNGSCSLVIAGGACTPGTVSGAFQSCASGSDCTCPQLCVDVGIGTGVCETPCPGAAPGTFGGACQVVTAGDGTCQPSQVNHPDGGVSLAGFCIPNGTETADGSSDCSVQEAEEFPPATPAELCVAGQICPAISQACATFCATPGQAGSCTAGQQCNFLFSGVSNAGYCGECMTAGGPCIAHTDCCTGLSCSNGFCG